MTLRNFQQYFLLSFIITAAVIILLSPLSSNVLVPRFGDMYNHIAAIVEAKLALHEHQFPLRIAPFALTGWRYAFFQFYSPTSYLFTGLVYMGLVPWNPYLAYKIMVGLAQFFGGIYIYRLANHLTSSFEASMLASLVYILVPYNIIVIDHIGAFNESLALGILPVILFYMWKFVEAAQLKYFLFATCGWYLLATVHLITFAYSALFIALFFILLYWPQKKLSNLWRVFLPIGFGILLAMWYLAPILYISKYLDVLTTFNSAFLKSAAPPLSNLLSPVPYININTDFIMDSIHPGIGLPVLLAVAVVIFQLLKHRLKSSPVVISLLILFATVFICIWSPINFWQWLPKSMLFLQYSWRLLSQLMWIGTLLFAIAVYNVFDHKLDKRHLILGSVLIIMANSCWLKITEIGFTSFDEYVKKPNFFYNEENYTLTPLYYARHVNFIDTMPVIISQDKIARPGALKIVIPHQMQSPVLTLEGEMPTAGSIDVLQNAAKTTLLLEKPGHFSRDIPVTESNQFNLGLKAQGGAGASKSQSYNLKIQGLALKDTHYKKLTISEVSSFCHQATSTTVCNMVVPKGTELMELPILFYPKLLRVSLNGKDVSYSSILINNRIMTAIKPLAGTTNKVEIKFVGLTWANWVSRLAWLTWCLCILWEGWAYMPNYKLWSFPRRRESIPE